MTVAQQEDLVVLEQLLWKRLQSEIPHGDVIKIGCAMSDGTLVVLSQHPSEVHLDAETIFAKLQQALQSLRPQVTQSVRFYLRVAGEKQAYAKHDFTLRPVELVIDETNVLHTNLDNEATTDDETNVLHTNLDNESTTEDIDRHLTRGVHPAQPFTSIPQNEVIRENPPHKLLEAKSYSRKLPQLQIPTPVLIVGGGVALAAFFSSAYVFSQPCVVGTCKPLQTAQQLNQAATYVMRRADSESDLLIARQQLEEANGSLKLIPRWSSRYQDANKLSQTLLTSSAILDQVIMAWQQASAAAQRSQKQPHSAQEWQVIQAMWQRAIAQMASVPKNSALSYLAQQKASEYQARLQPMNQRLNLELEASKKLTQAKNTAQLATKYQSNAQSWQSWQQVKTSWQTAVNTLAAIPKTSTVYQEAQQLLKAYRPQLVAASDRISKEQEANKGLFQAISLANLAKRDEQQNQFTNAVTHWKQALTHAKQVPSNTTYNKQVQSLVNSYSSALQQAQAKLKVTNVLQEARTDLNRTCSGKLRVCDYAVNDKLILVKLTSSYEQTVERSYVTARQRGDRQTQADVAFHYRTLRQALEAISDNAGIPLQVQEADGSSLHSYQPRS